MKKLLLLLIFLLPIVFIAPVHAAEITPDSDDYSFGSTSEFSTAETVTAASDTNSLADTGDNTWAVATFATMLIGSSALLLRRAYRR